MKKIFSLLLILGLMLQMASFAGEAPLEKPKPLTYEEAVDIMLKAHPELLSLQKQMDIQKEIIEEVKYESKRLKDVILDNEDKIMQRANAVYVDPITAEIALNTLKRTYDNKVFELKQNLFDYMIGYMTKNNKLALAKKQVAIEEKNHQKNQNELKLGKITSNDLRASEIALQTAKNNYTTLAREVEIALTEFNFLINQSLETQYSPDQSTIEKKLNGFKVDLDTLDLRGLTEKNIACDATLAAYKEEVTKIEAQIRVERVYSSGVSAFKEFDKKLADNAYDVSKRQNAIAYKVLSDFNQLKLLSVDMKIADNNVLLAKQNLKAQKVLHQIKRITDLELLKAEKSLTEAENHVRELTGQYHKACQTFLRFY